MVSLFFFSVFVFSFVFQNFLRLFIFLVYGFLLLLFLSSFVSSVSSLLLPFPYLYLTSPTFSSFFVILRFVLSLSFSPCFLCFLISSSLSSTLFPFSFLFLPLPLYPLSFSLFPLFIFLPLFFSVYLPLFFFPLPLYSSLFLAFSFNYQYFMRSFHSFLSYTYSSLLLRFFPYFFSSFLSFFLSSPFILSFHF